VKVWRIAWLGVRTERASEMVGFFRDTLGLAVVHAEDGSGFVHGPVVADEDDAAWVHFRAPDGNLYELTQGSDLEPMGSCRP
jgi:hypothetical protein